MQNACHMISCGAMGFAVRVRSAGQKYGPTCHQRNRADVTEFVTLVRLPSLGQHVGVLALAGYQRRKSPLTAGPKQLLTSLKIPLANPKALQIIPRLCGFLFPFCCLLFYFASLSRHVAMNIWGGDYTTLWLL